MADSMINRVQPCARSGVCHSTDNRPPSQSVHARKGRVVLCRTRLSRKVTPRR